MFAKSPQYAYAFAIKGYGHDSFNSFGNVSSNMQKTLFITKKSFQIIHTILMLIAFTYIIAVNLDSLSQILDVHKVSLKNKGYHCRMSQTYHIHVAAL